MLVSPTVKIEVIDQGEAVSAPEVRSVHEAVRRRWVRVGRLTAPERKAVEQVEARTRLGRGEVESIAMARRRKLPLIVDDREARVVAGGLGLDYMGTAGVLFEAFRRGFMTLDDFDGAVRDLAKVLWISPDVVAELLRRAREVGR